MAVELVGKSEKGIFSHFLRKASQILNKEVFPVNRSTTDWERLKVDLEALSKPQLDLILSLIEQMKTVNRENQKETKPSRN